MYILETTNKLSNNVALLLNILIYLGIIISCFITLYLAVFFISSALLKPYRLKMNIDDYYNETKKELNKIYVKKGVASEELINVVEELSKARQELADLQIKLSNYEDEKTDSELEKSSEKIPEEMPVKNIRKNTKK